jgi:tetratricopeptide (TPR) repeat protein
MTAHNPHYSIADILAFLDGNEELVDVNGIRTHVLGCLSCATEVAETEALSKMLSDPSLWALAEECDPDSPQPPLDFLHAGEGTGWIQHLIDAGIRKLDTDPEEALSVLSDADALASLLTDSVAVNVYRGDIAKNRANALRMLGRYAEALAAADEALDLTEDYATGAFAGVQARYTRATVLFKMGRYFDAAKDAQECGDAFAEFGDDRRRAYAAMLEAAAWTEEGAIARARAAYGTAREQLIGLDDAAGLAQVTASLAVCALRSGDYAEASALADDAHERFRALANEAELVRVDWIRGAIAVATGEETGLDQLIAAAASFDALGMSADAAFVHLDLVQEYLKRGIWSEASELARAAAITLARSGARMHVHEALAYLREAVEGRTATADLVDYVRRYVRRDEAQKFVPPS